jgi:hypothetical protein
MPDRLKKAGIPADTGRKEDVEKRARAGAESMGTSMTAVALVASLTLGLGKTYPPTRGAKNPRPAPAEVLDTAVPLGSDGCNHTEYRAGFPFWVSRCARPGVTPQYCGYYVGGGCILPRRAGNPGHWRGTFGLDYCRNKILPHHVKLGWSCPPLYKGGTGAYKTDGPPVKNVFAIKLAERPEQPEEAPEAGHGACTTCEPGHGGHH